MNIGALSFTPHIYNTNTLSGSSLSRVSAIGNDLTSAKTDYSSLTDSSLNINPLGRGESASFFDILDMQMQMSRRNAARVMAPEEAVQGIGNMADTQNMSVADLDVNAVQEAEVSGQGTAEDLSVSAEEAVMPASTAIDTAQAVEDFKPVSASEETFSMQFDRNLFQMQRAAEAYRVNMIA